MRVLINVFVICLFPFIFNSLPYGKAGKMTVERYCNTRFNYCLDYPTAIFDGIVESDNDDGIQLVSEKYHLTLSVAGSHNVLEWSFQELYEMEMNDIIAHYEVIREIQSVFTDAYYEAEWKADGCLLYTKIYNFNGTLVTIELETAENAPTDIYELLKEQLIITQNT